MADLVLIEDLILNICEQLFYLNSLIYLSG